VPISAISNTFSACAPSTTTPVANPTWFGEIRYMFTPTDVTHMQNAASLDLTSYDAVVGSAGGIYSQVSAGMMPPGAPWTSAWSQTFLNWISNNYPRGTNTAPPPKIVALSAAVTATRIRKDITTLSPAELADLKKAFTAIMAKDPNDPNSYFVQAGYHWLPAHPGLWCQHHVPAYNPWHRAYLISFENALRSVPGCEIVTLPYWDITTPFPDVLKNAPFDKYTLPKDIGGGFAVGYVTQRDTYPEIQSALQSNQVSDDINRAMAKTTWEDFHGLFGGSSNNTIIMAHDSGHVSIGPTMSKQDVAAYDPVFWFFHCNWDRLFWKWQQENNATTLQGLLTTIGAPDSQSRKIFTDLTQESLFMIPFSNQPLNLKVVDVVDSAGSLDVDYRHPQMAVASIKLPRTQLTSLASKKFYVNTNIANVRIDGLNRLKIPGSFKVHLLKDGKIIASRGFFQPVEVEKCENCVKNAIVHFDFELPLATVAGGQLSVRVEPMDKSFVGDSFPPKLMGNPTVDVNLLLRHE
jgi:tyrosinase